MARNSYRHGRQRSISKDSFVEQFRGETVAYAVVVPLRGRARPTPGWWEAFDDEGQQCRRILQNLSALSSRVMSVNQISIGAARRVLGLVSQGAAQRDLVSNSFPFFTGLCEKALDCRSSLALLALGHK